nr:hypothetical protein [Tanacetum cinerariifolium]
MRNEISVHGAAVTIPIDAVKAVNARFVNTLYGYFIGDRLAFPLMENYKDEIKHVPVWVKMHHVPIVAYSDIGLSLISTHIRKPLMLDSYTSNMCIHSWGRSTYARVLIKISADVDLMDSLVIAIPHYDKEGHTFAMIEIEYEWTPRRCASCKIFDHVSDKCPKLPKEVSNVKITDDGFTEVKKKKAKGKKNNKKQKVISKENVKSVKNGSSKPIVDLTKVVNDSDSEDVDEYITMKEGTKSGSQESSNAQGASTPFEGTRIIVGWNHDDVDVSVIHQDPQVIHTRVWIKADRKEFFCSFVYAHNYYIHRCSLWNGLCLHKNYINNRPCCLLGDFNASLYVDDTSIGPSSLDITMREFKECVETMEVIDVQRTGLHFTWNQKPKVKPKPFKFFNVAILDKRFKDVVRERWSHNVSGFDMFRVVKKLKGLKKPIRKMMYDKGNLQANVIRLRENLDRLQAALNNDPSNVSIHEEEAAAVVAFNEAILLEEKFLKQKAKITWLREGDANTAYFHKMVRIRVSRSRIGVITDINGGVFQNDDVAKAFINHYEVFLGQAGATTAFVTNNLFSTRLDANEALDMVRVVSSQEVKSAMYSMGNDKLSGSDGFTAAFFKDTWNIIGSDVTKATCEFFTNGRLLMELNHTILALIPKVNAPARVNNYRPILYCNVLFKCISKIIANRFKDSLKRLISPNQSAFVLGRSISDNILLTQEIMHNYHLDRRVPRCAFKVDIQKAYDTVDWEFLWAAPFGFGFHDRMIAWIMKCVSTTSFSININGSLHELELINLCFADDLFLFAHGDVYSASIIKEALDEFRDALGCNPSMPKSKAYFCNVLNHTKLAILHVLSFEEDRLPELIDKVHNRVNDWKNKSLSIAGRLQLIQSVLGSLNVFWASIFGLPSHVLLDIEQIMRGFLWCQGSISSGKAKVAWEVACLPKKEGGLGIRRLDQFNKALTVSHIWKLLSFKESLWVKWCVASPLCNIISARDIARSGFSLTSKVRKCIHGGMWSSPNDWMVKYPILISILVPVLNDAKHDVLEWRNSDGSFDTFLVQRVWETIRPRDNEVPASNYVLAIENMQLPQQQV